MGPGYTGTKTLLDKLTKILCTHIKLNLPEITKEIGERTREVNERLTELGPAMPEEPNEKMQMVWTMVMEFCVRFKNAISGREHIKKNRKERSTQSQEGAQIKIMYYHFLKVYARQDYKITQEYDDFINDTITFYERDSMPGFPPANVFVPLIQPKIELLKNPVVDLVQDVYNYLKDLANNIQRKCFVRFPSFGEKIMKKIIEIMQEERENTRYLVESIIESEQTNMFTNDPEYLNTRKEEDKEEEEEEKQNRVLSTSKVQNKPNNDSEPFKKEKKVNKSAMVFLNELKTRLNSCFRIVVRNVRDKVPRVIGDSLVRAVQTKIQIELFKRFNKMFDTVDRSMGEPLAVIQERKALIAQLETLQKADRALNRDPEIITMINTSDDELLLELRQEETSSKKADQQEAIDKCMQLILPWFRKASTSKPTAPTAVPATNPPKQNPVVYPPKTGNTSSVKQNPPALAKLINLFSDKKW